MEGCTEGYLLFSWTAKLLRLNCLVEIPVRYSASAFRETKREFP